MHIDNESVRMKKQILALILISIFGLTINIEAQKPLCRYFSPYLDETTGLYGLQYGDEVCIIPQYEKVKTTFSDPLYGRDDNHSVRWYESPQSYFSFLQDGKWGVASLYQTIEKPLWEDVAFIANENAMFFVKDKGKWGIRSTNGIQLVDCKFDTIYTSVRVNNVIYPYSKQILANKNKYFLAGLNGKKLLIDIMGNGVGDETLANNIADNKDRTKFFQQVVKLEDKHSKQNKTYMDEVKRHINSISTLGIYDMKLGDATDALRFMKLDGSTYLVKGSYARKLESADKFDNIRGIYYTFEKDGKLGIADVFGNVIAEPQYNSVWYEVAGFRVGIDDETDGAKTRRFGMIDKDGNLLIPIKYKSLEHDESLLYGKLDAKDKYFDIYTMHGNFAGNSKDKEALPRAYKIECADSSRVKTNIAVKRDEQLEEKIRHAVPVGVDYYQNGNEYWAILPNGLDLGVLRYDDPKSRLRRNPNSLVAYVENARETVRGNQTLELYLDAIVIAEKAGYKNSAYITDLKERHRRLCIDMAKEEKERLERERIERINARIDAISGALQSGLNSMMEAYNATSGSQSTSSPSSSSPTKHSKTHGRTSDNDFSLSKNHAYNSDCRTYRYYDSLLAAHFAGNRSASHEEVKQWQTAMRQLRTKWEKQGKDFLHSSNEDR